MSFSEKNEPLWKRRSKSNDETLNHQRTWMMMFLQRGFLTVRNIWTESKESNPRSDSTYAVVVGEQRRSGSAVSPNNFKWSRHE